MICKKCKGKIRTGYPHGRKSNSFMFHNCSLEGLKLVKMEDKKMMELIIKHTEQE